MFGERIGTVSVPSGPGAALQECTRARARAHTLAHTPPPHCSIENALTPICLISTPPYNFRFDVPAASQRQYPRHIQTRR